MDLVSMLPWWAGVVLALVLYLLLHRIASQPVATAVQPGQVGAMVTQSVWRGLATVVQYVVPLICLGGAGISAWRRRKRRTLVADVTQSKASDALNGMSWREFEMLVGEGFRLQGYQVVETGGGGADGGVDLMLTQGGEKFLVQCKQWRAFKVGVDVVRELYGVMAAKGATGGFVVTSGRFSDAAASFATGRNVKLIDGPKLHEMIRKAQSSASARATARPSTVGSPTAAVPPGAASLPTCPLCSMTMTRRTAKRGANAGNEFWGCTGYPACRGTRQVA